MRVIDVIGANKTIEVDYKDHVVLQFSTLNNESEPKFKFKFMHFDTFE